MSEKEPVPFDFWIPTSELGTKVMIWSLCIIGVLLFIKGWSDEETMEEILFFDVGLGVGGWYIIFNIGRFAYSQMSRTETVTTMREAHREKAELEALRRRKEIQQLKAELGDNDKDDAPGDDGSDDVNNP